MKLLHIILASLVLNLGCASGPIGSQDSSTIASGDAKQSDGSISELKPGKFEALVELKGKSPDGKPATYYICRGGCYAAGNSEIQAEQVYKDAKEWSWQEIVPQNYGELITVHVERPGYIFADWQQTFKGDNTHPDIPVVYTNDWPPGTCALDPTSDYAGSDGTNKMSFKTYVKNGQIYLDGLNGYLDGKIVLMTYNKWSFEDDIAISLGTISDDLSTIIFSVKFKGGKEYGGTVLRK